MVTTILAQFTGTRVDPYSTTKPTTQTTYYLTINHKFFLHKLSYYGIRGKALEWFRSYLTNRSQFVSINNNNSSSLPITCGMPQGSLLGPLLFITYVNDIQKTSDLLSFILFADDSNIFFSHENINQLIRIVNSELSKVTDWIKANKLSINLQKINFMLLSNKINNYYQKI